MNCALRRLIRVCSADLRSVGFGEVFRGLETRFRGLFLGVLPFVFVGERAGECIFVDGVWKETGVKVTAGSWTFDAIVSVVS